MTDFVFFLELRVFVWGFVCLQIIIFAYLNMQNKYGNVALFMKELSFSVGAQTQTHTHYCIENPGTVD